MTANMMQKIEEAKKMVRALYGEDCFMPATYEDMRYQWDGATPTWNTLKKYAKEAGLVAEDFTWAWHSDGSMLAELSGIKEGTIFHHTVYRFAE